MNQPESAPTAPPGSRGRGVPWWALIPFGIVAVVALCLAAIAYGNRTSNEQDVDKVRASIEDLIDASGSTSTDKLEQRLDKLTSQNEQLEEQIDEAREAAEAVAEQPEESMSIAEFDAQNGESLAGQGQAALIESTRDFIRGIAGDYGDCADITVKGYDTSGAWAITHAEFGADCTRGAGSPAEYLFNYTDAGWQFVDPKISGTDLICNTGSEAGEAALNAMKEICAA